MAEQHGESDRRIDEAGEESFPASDPPAFTPEQCIGGHPRRHDGPDGAHRRAVAEEKVERARDPHGAAPAEGADQDEPKASPTADRHRTETAVQRVKPRE